ncbi:MAG TPA: glycosyltransferase family 2 protein, partial [Myxococcota bacterium]|nr:glycosyltransferase family 2 protein [Myxococcota bacterium]
RRHLPDVVVIDDGSAKPGRDAVAALGAAGLAHVVHRQSNGGKGAAVKTGFEHARSLGFTHALQLDADGQHDIERIPAFLDAARASPTALVLGHPEYDAAAPRGRRIARKITIFWVNIETWGKKITDPMIGFRVYPLADVDVARRCGDRMDFDIEVAVRLAWRRLPIINLPVAVRYLSAAEGGVSHFRMFRDNVRISWLHTRLTTISIFLGLGRAFRRLFGGRS